MDSDLSEWSWRKKGNKKKDASRSQLRINAVVSMVHEAPDADQLLSRDFAYNTFHQKSRDHMMRSQNAALRGKWRQKVG